MAQNQLKIVLKDQHCQLGSVERDNNDNVMVGVTFTVDNELQRIKLFIAHDS